MASIYYKTSMKVPVMPLFTLFSLRILPFSLFLLFIQTTFAQDEFTSYLFAYFTGNNISQEAIRFALSDDGHNFKALNHNDPVINSADISEMGGVRDPHILRGENNDYYMVVTDMVSAKGWSSNRGLVLLKSENLVDWSSSAINITHTFSKYSTADRVWAPQVIYDPDVGKYMVYFAMRLGGNDRDRIYYAYADSSFTELETEPEVLFEYKNMSAIDADIIYLDGIYHLFFKTEGSGNGIKKATSDKLTEGYVLYDTYLQLTSEAVEGSSVFKLINSDTYVLMYDVYMSGRYEFALSTDLKNFSHDPEPISFDFTPRHGTIIPITEKEKRDLNRRWNPTATISRKESSKQCIFSNNLNGNTVSFQVNDVSDNGSISIFNAAGKEVCKKSLFKKTALLHLTYLPAGVYQAVYSNGTGMKNNIRFVIR